MVDKIVKNIQDGKMNKVFNLYADTVIKNHKVLCSLGIHTYKENFVLKYLTNGRETEKCLYCSRSR